MNTSDRQRPQATAAYTAMVRRVRTGQHGQDVTICPEWLGTDGLDNFVDWFKKFNPPYTASVSKDLLGKTNVFSPETCTVVPSKFLNWFHKAIMRYSVGETTAGWAAYFHSTTGQKAIRFFPTKEAAENDWREKMVNWINGSRIALDASDKRIYPRCMEIVATTINGEEDPLIFFSRRELRRQ